MAACDVLVEWLEPETWLGIRKYYSSAQIKGKLAVNQIVYPRYQS